MPTASAGVSVEISDVPADSLVSSTKSNAFASVLRALAALPDRDLDGLFAGVASSPPEIRGLKTWIKHATVWERDRRLGRHYPLHAPHTLIVARERRLSLVTLAVLTEALRDQVDSGSVTVAFFLESAAAVLRDVEREKYNS